MNNNNNVEPRKHYYLIHGSVVFLVEGQNEVGSIELNGLLVIDKSKIGLHELNISQQLLQRNFYQRMPEGSKIEVRDVVLSNFAYLGSFTESEFRNVPEDVQMAVQKKQEEAAVPASEQIIDQILEAEVPDENPDLIQTPEPVADGESSTSSEPTTDTDIEHTPSNN